MIFEMVDVLKEKITLINETVLAKLDKIEDDNSIANANKEVIYSDMNHLSYTPVNAETFAIWCEQYMEKLREEKEANLVGNEHKPTGRELFEVNRNAFDDLTLDDDADEVEAVNLAAVKVEEAKGGDMDDLDEEDGEEKFVYDRTLFDADGLDEEDVDFDDDE